MTPVPSPLPPAVADVLHQSSSLNTRLDSLGTHIARALMGAHVAHTVPVSAMHSPHVAAVAAGATLLGCTAPACRWCWCRRRYLRQSARGLVSPRCWVEGWRWHSHVGKVENLRGNRPGPKSIARWPTRAGVTHLLALKGGMNLKMLEELVPDMAADLECMDLEFKRVYENQGLALASIQRRDVFKDSTPWPWLDKGTTNFFGPIPVAVDLNGQLVTIDLRERNALLAGEPGSGKTVSLWNILAAAALDLRVRIHIFAGKNGTDFRVLQPVCETFITDDEDDEPKLKPALAMLKARMDKVYRSYDNGSHTVDWDTVAHADLIVVDEPMAFPPVLWKYLLAFNARGRAAAFMHCLATQRPSGKIMDTDLRALYQIRIGHRIEDAGMKMALGDGYGQYSATSFGPERAGECWLIPNDRDPVHCRAVWLTDADKLAVVARATRLRSNQDRSTPTDGEVTPPPAPFSTSLSNGSTGGHSDLPGEAPSLPQETRKPLEGYQRTTLEALSDRGEPATVRELADALEERDYEIRRRLNRLERLGLVAGARRAHPPGEGEGAREPKLWSVTEAGVEELLRSAEREHEEAAV